MRDWRRIAARKGTEAQKLRRQVDQLTKDSQYTDDANFALSGLLAMGWTSGEAHIAAGDFAKTRQADAPPILDRVTAFRRYLDQLTTWVENPHQEPSRVQDVLNSHDGVGLLALRRARRRLDAHGQDRHVEGARALGRLWWAELHRVAEVWDVPPKALARELRKDDDVTSFRRC